MKKVDEFKKILQDHKTTLKDGYGVIEIGLFGSYTKGSQKETKVSPKGAKGSQKEAKASPKGTQREPKRGKREPKASQKGAFGGP